jgi:hypothetical protein
MMATSPSSSAVSAAADVWTSRSGEPSNNRRFPTSEISGSRSDSRRSPKTEFPRLVSTSAHGRSETKPSRMRTLATHSSASTVPISPASEYPRALGGYAIGYVFPRDAYC